jgi:hypothetical protein
MRSEVCSRAGLPWRSEYILEKGFPNHPCPKGAPWLQSQSACYACGWREGPAPSYLERTGCYSYSIVHPSGAYNLRCRADSGTSAFRVLSGHHPGSRPQIPQRPRSMYSTGSWCSKQLFPERPGRFVPGWVEVALQLTLPVGAKVSPMTNFGCPKGPRGTLMDLFSSFLQKPAKCAKTFICGHSYAQTPL